MSDEGKPLEPEQLFKKVVWRSILGISSSLQQSTTWTITGVAAIAGLLISQLDSVSRVVSVPGLKWGLVLFAISLPLGIVSRQFGMAITNGLETIAKLEALLQSPEGNRIITMMATEPKKIVAELAEPFWWPLSSYIRKAGLKGLTDYLSTEKSFIRMFCIQICTNAFHNICGAAGIVIIALSIKG